MIITAPVAGKALHGLKRSLPLCTQTGRVQPCLPLALAYAFDLPTGPFSYRIQVRRAHQYGKPPSTYRVKQNQVENLTERINPPSQTLPVPLDFPEREPDQNTAKYWWKVGKAFWAFYKQGSKNIYANRNAAKEVRAKMAAANSQHATTASAPDAGSKERLLDGVTRSEFQLLRRSKAEMRRVPAFAVILAVFGEWTPLLVMFATPIVPYNCRIPRQIRKSREKQEARRRRSFRGDSKSLASTTRGQIYVPSPRDVSSAKSIEGSDLGLSQDATLHICRSLNLYPAWMDALLLANPIGATVLLSSMRLPSRLSKHIHEYLNVDDTRLLQACTDIKPTEIPSRLSDEEVLVAAEERGIDVLGRKLGDVRRDLGLWFETSRRRDQKPAENFNVTEPILRMLLTRPNKWEDIKRKMSSPDHQDTSASKKRASASA